MRIVFLFVFLFSIAIVIKLGDIQFVKGSYWKELAEKSGLKYRIVPSTRGNIYSDNGSLLATSLPFFKVSFDPTVADRAIFDQGIDSLALNLHYFFGDYTKDEYKRRIINARSSGRQYLQLSKRKIGYQEKKELTQWPIFREGRNRGGVIFEKVYERFRPFSYLGHRTIGLVNEDNNFGYGLEYSFNAQLAGQQGEALFQRMAGGSWKPVNDKEEVPPVDGLDIQTTIDINLQDVAESALLRAVEEHEADYGCVAVMEVSTGQIKAISNLTRTSTGRYSERVNYIVGSQGLTEPGSTFKLASALALLEEKAVTLGDSIETGFGEVAFYDKVMRDSKVGGFGKITFKEAFANSSNVAISKLIDATFGLNPQRFIDYLSTFYLTEPLGFQMVGEGIPYVKSPEDPTWSGITLPWMSIGYELKLTPLQTLSFYNAVANKGYFVQPIIVTKAKRANKAVEDYQPVVSKKPIASSQTLEKLHELLLETVENGTARNIRNNYYSIAGKTGTAQKVKRDGIGYSEEHSTSFVGYFPADNPKYSCIVVIDNPKGDRQNAGVVAAPVFKTIADKIYSLDINMHAPLPRGQVADQSVFPHIKGGNLVDLQRICDELGIPNYSVSQKEWVRTSIDDQKVAWKDAGVRVGVVPDVRGMTLRDALYLLENQGLQVSFNGNGRVKSQTQDPGSRALRGSRIILDLG